MNANLETARHSAVGVWQSSPDATAMLRVDPELVAADGALDRLVAAVVAVRDLALPGVVAVADLVDDAGQIVVLTATPVTPSLADLLGAADGATGPGLAGVLAAARDVGQTLAALHRAGITHGAVGLDTAVVTAAGTILVNETAIAAALTGRTITAGEDIRAWATLVRTLAHAWTAGADADRLTAAASAAERRGLEAALPLLDGPDTATDGAGPDRAGLAAAVARTSSPVAVPVAVPVIDEARPTTTAPAQSRATLLGRRAGARRPDASDAGSAPAARDEGTTVEPSIRFGPGVPAEPASGQAWPKVAGSPVTTRTTRRRAAGATLITLVIAVAVAGWLLWQHGGPLSVARISVAPAAPLGHSCDVTVDVVGTIHTDGRGGVVTYQWLRNDGESSAVLHETVAPGTEDALVHLHWSFSGRGTFPASATLSVISPDPTTARTDFTYSCP